MGLGGGGESRPKRENHVTLPKKEKEEGGLIGRGTGEKRLGDRAFHTPIKKKVGGGRGRECERRGRGENKKKTPS